MNPATPETSDTPDTREPPEIPETPEAPEIAELNRLAARAGRAIHRGWTARPSRARLERELSAAIASVAPAFYAAPEYCRATEVLAELQRSLRSEGRTPLHEDDDATLS